MKLGNGNHGMVCCG